MITCICFTTDRICSGAGGLFSWRQNVGPCFCLLISLSVNTYHIREGPSSHSTWFNWCWQVMGRTRYLLLCTGLNNSDAELSENKAADLVWLELSARAVGWVSRRLWSWEVGRTDHLPYMQNVLRGVTYTIRWCHPSETDLAVLHSCSPLHKEQVVSVAPSSAQRPPRASLLQPLGLRWGGRTCWWQ